MAHQIGEKRDEHMRLVAQMSPARRQSAAGMLQPTELSGYQSASPDSSGQEQGGVSARLRPAATARVSASPFRGRRGESIRIANCHRADLITERYGFVKNEMPTLVGGMQGAFAAQRV